MAAQLIVDIQLYLISGKCYSIIWTNKFRTVLLFQRLHVIYITVFQSEFRTKERTLCVLKGVAIVILVFLVTTTCNFICRVAKSLACARMPSSIGGQRWTH
jgi:hypothetical protein